MNTVSVVGLGKLGQPLAACFAARGFETIGVDIDERVVDSINRGVPSIIEPGLQELIITAGRRLRATQNHEEAVSKTDVSFILVPTPSDPDGHFSNKYVESALKSLAVSLGRSSKKYHLFVLNSTVIPGSSEGSLIPIIEEFSGRRLNAGFGFCYCPELVALGSVIRDHLNPDFVIIGQSNDHDGNQVATIYKRLCENDPPILQMSVINAEMVKVCLNCYLTMKISFANSLANICEKIPGANVDTITRALGTDRRIAPYYLRGGLGFGGTCFPRDTKAFIALARRFGNDAELIRAVERINEFQDRHLEEVVLSHVPFTGERAVSILGLAFKPNTPVIEESPAIKLIEGLLRQGIKVSVYDPLAMESTRAMLGNRIEYANSVQDCLSRSYLCVIATPWEEFRCIDDSYITYNPTIIIDCWRALDRSRLGERVRYIAWGIGDMS